MLEMKLVMTELTRIIKDVLMDVNQVQTLYGHVQLLKPSVLVFPYVGMDSKLKMKYVTLEGQKDVLNVGLFLMDGCALKEMRQNRVFAQKD